MQELPQEPEELFQWMVRLYQEKEEMLDSYYKTGTKKDYIRWIYIDLTGTISGQFPHTMFTDDSSNYTKEPRLIRHDPVRFLLLHLFYMVSGCMFLKVFSSCYNLIFWRLRSIWNTNTLKTSMCFWMAPHLVTFYLILSVTNSLILITVSSIHFLFLLLSQSQKFIFLLP